MIVIPTTATAMAIQVARRTDSRSTAKPRIAAMKKTYGNQRMISLL